MCFVNAYSSKSNGYFQSPLEFTEEGLHILLKWKPDSEKVGTDKEEKNTFLKQVRKLRDVVNRKVKSAGG